MLPKQLKNLSYFYLYHGNDSEYDIINFWSYERFEKRLWYILQYFSPKTHQYPIFIFVFKVGWLKAEDQTILSLHERVVTENRRIDIDVDNNTYWRLKIRQLQRSDKGCYMCQINTQVMKKQIGCVDVKGNWFLIIFCLGH